jgi:eukaryotic-like serine/threonine-protein kinase
VSQKFFDPPLPVAPERVSASTEDARAYLQRRLSLFALVCFSVSFGFLLAGVLIGATFYRATLTASAFLAKSFIFHAAATAVAGLEWLLTRRGRIGARTLAWLDAGVTVASVLLFGLMGASIPATFGWLQALLATNFVLMVRAVAVPSTGTRTMVIGILASTTATLAVAFVGADVVVSSPIAGSSRAQLEVILYMILWLAAAVAVTTFASRIIFGLQQEVRSARRVGQYLLKHKIGEGGMGEVYLATHAMLRRETAIKLLLPNRIAPTALARFEREVQQLARLANPNTVAIYDYGRTPEGIFYYAMEYLDGLNLDELVRAAGPLPPARVIHILEQICGSLAEAHGMGLVHRDIKPANVFLCRRGALDAVKVLDFGLVKDLSGGTEVTLTANRAFLGTPHYASPEAIQDPEHVTAASDLYAVAAVGYYLLTGSPVFTAATFVEIGAGHLYKQPESPSARLGQALPQDLEELVLQGLAKRPEDRPATAQAFRKALRACSESGRWTEEDASAWWQSTGASRPREGQASHTPMNSTIAIDLVGR